MSKKQINLKLLLLLAIHCEGLNYKEISKKTDYHINTVSRYVSALHNLDIIDIKQVKSNSVRGRKWVNVVKLKKELHNKTIPEFFQEVSKRLKCSLNDLFVDCVISA